MSTRPDADAAWRRRRDDEDDDDDDEGPTPRHPDPGDDEATGLRKASGRAVDATKVPVVGRRKEAVVRVRLMPGKGEFKLNGRALDSYFPNKVHQQLIRGPLVTVAKSEEFDVVATLSGGGIAGQAGALRLAITRALVALDPDDRPALKRAGFLTRDARVKERKKYGLKKARKAPQYSKR